MLPTDMGPSPRCVRSAEPLLLLALGDHSATQLMQDESLRRSNSPRRGSDSRTHGVSLRRGELGDDVLEPRRLSCGEIRPGREHGFHMLWSLASCSRSAERSTAVSLPVFLHQCAVTWVSRATSPLLWTIGTAQLLAYSVTSPVTT